MIHGLQIRAVLTAEPNGAVKMGQQPNSGKEKVVVNSTPSLAGLGTPELPKNACKVSPYDISPPGQNSGNAEIPGDPASLSYRGGLGGQYLPEIFVFMISPVGEI